MRQMKMKMYARNQCNHFRQSNRHQPSSHIAHFITHNTKIIPFTEKMYSVVCIHYTFLIHSSRTVFSLFLSFSFQLYCIVHKSNTHITLHLFRFFRVKNLRPNMCVTLTIHALINVWEIQHTYSQTKECARNPNKTDMYRCLLYIDGDFYVVIVAKKSDHFCQYVCM